MQLKLPFPNPKNQPPNPTITPWEEIDEEARGGALEILARLIAQMLAAEPAKEAGDE